MLQIVRSGISSDSLAVFFLRVVKREALAAELTSPREAARPPRSPNGGNATLAPISLLTVGKVESGA
jgi:hypothetical protein